MMAYIVFKDVKDLKDLTLQENHYKPPCAVWYLLSGYKNLDTVRIMTFSEDLSVFDAELCW